MDEFRQRAMDDIARLLAHWRTIEFWIKKAEQINKQAIIPAINELRYASRQVFNAFRVIGKTDLNDGDKSVINRRLIIAEQYLFNAEHDICDAIVTFYDEVVSDLEREFGRTAITIQFPEFPDLKRRIQESQDLILDARQDYEKRLPNYTTLRTNHFPHFIDSHRRLVEAEVSVREQKSANDRALTIAQAKIGFLGVFSIVTGIAALVAVPLSIYLWVFAHDDFCKVHGKNAILGIVCSGDQ
jgi:hypothetical protein